MSPTGRASASHLRAALGLSLRAELLLAVAVIVVVAAMIAAAGVALVASAADAEAGRRVLGWRPALFLIVDVAAACALALLAVRRLVARPVRRLVAMAEAVGSGASPAPLGPPLPGELGRLAAALASLDDRMARERAQRARSEQMAGIGRLAAGVAHEIGNPLGAINGYAYVLGGRLAHASDLREAVSGIEREAARIDRIVRGLLDYARPRMPTPTPIDINDTVRSAVSILAAQGALRRVRVREDLDPTKPTLFGERHRLEQVFINLLLNAVDASPDGSEVVVRTERYPRAALTDGVVRRADDPPLAFRPRPPLDRARLWLERTRPPAEVVNVVVADAGPGVPLDERERIFEPFVTTKARDRGTGLGLAIVTSAVEAFGGTIWVERSREGGAAFHMLFPVAVGHAAPLRRSKPSPSPAPHSVPRR